MSSFYAAFFFGEWYHLSALAALVDLAWCSQLHGLVCQHLSDLPVACRRLSITRTLPVMQISFWPRHTTRTRSLLFCFAQISTQKFHSKPAFFDSIFGYWCGVRRSIWMFPKIGGFPPKSSILIRVFYYFHHPFWVFSPIFGKHPYNSNKNTWADHFGESQLVSTGQPQCAKLEGCEMAVKKVEKSVRRFSVSCCICSFCNDV